MAKKGFGLWGLAVLVLAGGLLGLTPVIGQRQGPDLSPLSPEDRRRQDHQPPHRGECRPAVQHPPDLRRLPQLRPDHQRLSLPAGLGPHQGRLLQAEALGAVRRHDGQVLTALFSPVGEKAQQKRRRNRPHHLRLCGGGRPQDARECPAAAAATPVAAAWSLTGTASASTSAWRPSPSWPNPWTAIIFRASGTRPGWWRPTASSATCRGTTSKSGTSSSSP